MKLSNNVEIPQIGLGVYKTSPDEASAAVYNALTVGYRHFDSAAVYKNEQEVCEAISKWIKEGKGKRSEVYYTTKIWDSDHGYDETKSAIEKALLLAKDIEYVDLILVHSPLSNTAKRHGTWLALQEAVDSGKVKSIGVSNYGPQHLEELFSFPDLKYKPVVNQIELHPWYQRKEIVEYCKSKNVDIQAYSPLVKAKKFGDAVLVSLAKKYEVDEAQILINWCLCKGYITLPKTISIERMKSNLHSSTFRLSPPDVEVLDGLDENFCTGWDPASFPADQTYVK